MLDFLALQDQHQDQDRNTKYIPAVMKRIKANDAVSTANTSHNSQ